MRMKSFAILLMVLLVTLAGLAFVNVGSGARPEVMLMGEWQEVFWTYEMVDGTSHTPDAGTSLSEELRNEITRGMVIHESETWRFGPGAALVLQKAGQRNDTLQWKLKGHGQMLELVFGDRHQEVYNIRELKEDELVLQFNNDMIARGVVRIILKRVSEHA